MIRQPSKIIIHRKRLMPKLSLLPYPNAPKVVYQKTISFKIPEAPSTWPELHLRALKKEGQDDSVWLMMFGIRIQGNCECRKNWSEELKQLPPDFQNYFAWSVAAHNLVNKRLGKPEISLEQARETWTPSAHA